MKNISRFIKDVLTSYRNYLSYLGLLRIFFCWQDLLRLIVGNQHMNCLIFISEFIDDVFCYVVGAKMLNFYAS